MARLLLLLSGLLTVPHAQGERPTADEAPSGQVRCWTTQGRFTIDLYKSWAPKSTKRFTRLVQTGYYDDQAVFRKIPGLMLAQFGQHFDIKRRIKEQEKPLKPQNSAGVPFRKGIISFASAQDTVVFIADDGEQADEFLTGKEAYHRPFGLVSEGLDVLERLHHYPQGSFHSNYTHDAEAFIHDGKDGIDNHWPHLDTIVACRLQGSEQYDDSFSESISSASERRQRLIAAFEKPERQAFYNHPSAETVPDEFVQMCKRCVKKILTREGKEGLQVFCVSTLACNEAYRCMSPKDEVQKKAECTKSELFRRWPAEFTFGHAADKDEL